MDVVKIDRVPPKSRPVEGVDYNVLPGPVAGGDPIRVIDGGTVMFCFAAIIAPPAPPRTAGLTYREFRELFTVAEQTTLDNYESDAYLTAIGLTPLTVEQKASVKTLFAAVAASGADRGINLLSARMGAALTAITAMGFIAPGRKAEIQAAAVKS